jgi:hypothetical protein
VRKSPALINEEGKDHFLLERRQGFRARDEPDKEGGRPIIPPGIYFRMLFVGYFEGLDSQRGIAWRCADSLGLRSFLGLGLTEETPAHASMTIIRQRLPEPVFDQVFVFVSGLLWPISKRRPTKRAV